MFNHSMDKHNCIQKLQLVITTPRQPHTRKTAQIRRCTSPSFRC